jgi:hypothetical protein
MGVGYFEINLHYGKKSLAALPLPLAKNFVLPEQNMSCAARNSRNQRERCNKSKPTPVSSIVA